MNTKRWILLLTMAGIAVSALLNVRTANAGTPEPYGAKVRFKEGAPVAFKDFTVTYLGKRRVVPKQYPRGWWVHDFEVEARGKKEKISWSSGTGAIDPTNFTVGGKNFQLEMGLAEKLGQLKEDEIVVSPH